PSFCLLALSVVACGGDVTDDRHAQSGAATASASSSSGAGGGQSASASSASTSSSASSTGAGGTGTDCAKVPEYIANLYQAASACAPSDPSLHCQDVVDGYCCPVVVESIQSAATQAYLDFLKLTQEQCPEIWKACNAVDCAF